MASSTAPRNSAELVDKGLKSPRKRKEFLREGKRPPNVFIAIPVDNANVHAKVREVQRRFIDAVPIAERYMESTRKHHLTLSLSAVKDDQITELSAVFTEKVKEIVSSPTLSNFRGTNLEIRGIGQFGGHRVVYCEVSAVGFLLSDLFEELNKLLETAGYPPLHRPEFSAHITIFKTRGRPKFTSEDWKEFRKVFDEIKSEDLNFGVQPVKEIQLLHMMLPKDHNGYYAKLASSMEETSILSKESFHALHEDCCAMPLRTRSRKMS